MLGDATEASPQPGNKCFPWQLVTRVKSHISAKPEMKGRGYAAKECENKRCVLAQAAAWGVLLGWGLSVLVQQGWNIKLDKLIH